MDWGHFEFCQKHPPENVRMYVWWYWKTYSSSQLKNKRLFMLFLLDFQYGTDHRYFSLLTRAWFQAVCRTKHGQEGKYKRKQCKMNEKEEQTNKWLFGFVAQAFCSLLICGNYDKRKTVKSEGDCVHNGKQTEQRCKNSTTNEQIHVLFLGTILTN